MLVPLDRDGERAVQLLPVGQQLVERARIDDGAGQDVGADLGLSRGRRRRARAPPRWRAVSGGWRRRAGRAGADDHHVVGHRLALGHSSFPPLLSSQTAIFRQIIATSEIDQPAGALTQCVHRSRQGRDEAQGHGRGTGRQAPSNGGRTPASTRSSARRRATGSRPRPRRRLRPSRPRRPPPRRKRCPTRSTRSRPGGSPATSPSRRRPAGSAVRRSALGPDGADRHAVGGRGRRRACCCPARPAPVRPDDGRDRPGRDSLYLASLSPARTAAGALDAAAASGRGDRPPPCRPGPPGRCCCSATPAPRRCSAAPSPRRAENGTNWRPPPGKSALW